MENERFDDFRCKRCGYCCTGEGYVNLRFDECAAIADHLGIPLEQFLEEYTRVEPGYERYLIDGEGEDAPCIFLERDAEGLAACRIQGDAKPSMCKGFPKEWRREGFEKWCAAFKKE